MPIPHLVNRKHRLWFAVLATLVLFPVMHQRADADPCPDDRHNAIFTLNGVLTLREDALKNQEELYHAVIEKMPTEERPATKFGFIYNENDNFSDFIEVILQSQGLSQSRIMRAMKGLEQFPDLSQTVYDQLANQAIWDGNKKSFAAFSRLKNTVRDVIVGGKRVVVVAHSQGNLLANSAGADSTFLTLEQRGSYATVNVAVPDDRVQLSPTEYTTSDYITLNKENGPHGDLIIDPLDKIARQLLGLTPPLPGNTPNEGPFPVNARTFNHSFVKAYLAKTSSGGNGPSRNEIAVNTVLKLLNLTIPSQKSCVQITGASCSLPDGPAGSREQWLVGGTASTTLPGMDGGGGQLIYVTADTKDPDVQCVGWTGIADLSDLPYWDFSIPPSLCSKRPFNPPATSWSSSFELNNFEHGSFTVGLMGGSLIPSFKRLATDSKDNLSCPGTYLFGN